MLKNLIATERPTQWVEFRDGFDIKVQYIPKAILSEISKSATKRVWDPVRKSHQDKLDGKELVKGIAREAIIDWRGLTVGKLSTIVPIKNPQQADPKVEVPYSAEDAELLLLGAYELEGWIRDIAFDAAVFSTVTENQLGNLRPTQGGS